MLALARRSQFTDFIESLGRSFRTLVGRNDGSLVHANIAECEPWFDDEDPGDPLASDTQHSKRRALVQQIQERNPSADDAFLAGFDESALEGYLRHLDIQGVRGKATVWQRESRSTGIAAYACNLD